MYAIKFKRKTKKRWMFLTSKGRGNYLRVHASQYSKDIAEDIVDKTKATNPEFDLRVVRM